MTSHLLDDPGLAAIAADLGVEWRAKTSFGRAWDDLREDERDEVRAATRHLVPDEILAVAKWERIK